MRGTKTFAALWVVLVQAVIASGQPPAASVDPEWDQITATRVPPADHRKATSDAGDEKPAFAFRGVVPSETSRADLLANERWGQPVETSTSGNDEVLRYRLRGYPDARVLIRGGRVETIDVTIAAGVSEEVAARAFGLGEPRSGPLPLAAQTGAVQPMETWTPRPYSVGGAVLFVESVAGESLARLMRIHSVGKTPAESHVSLDSGDTEIALKGQDARSRQIVKFVVNFLDKKDYGDRKLDDALAAQWLERFLTTLDPGKQYLLREDVEGFRKRVPTLADRAREGDIGFAYDVFETYVRRRTRTLQLVTEFLDAEHDFTLDEVFEATRADTPWPENEIESREIVRKRVKYELLLRKLDGASDREAVERVRRHFAHLFQLPKQVDDETLLEWTLASLGAARGTADFASKRTYEDRQITLRNRMVGIGASLKIVDGQLVVQQIVLGSPAHADGRLAKGDVIVSVGQGDSGPFSSLHGTRLEDATALIRGPQGSAVRLLVKPQGKGEEVEMRLRRDAFQPASVRSTTFDATATGGAMTGWVALHSFYKDAPSGRSSAGDVAKILADFREQGVAVVVLDLRSSAGGPLAEVTDLFGLFADGPVLNIKDATGRVSGQRTGQPTSAEAKIGWHRPLVVLTSTLSDSGAALLAAALQDHARGLVLGDSRTQANVTIQTYLEIGPQLFQMQSPPNLGTLKYTQAIAHRCNGASLQRLGVRADIILPSFTENSENEWADAIESEAVPAATYARLGFVTPEIVATLTRSSEERRRRSPQFAEFERQAQESRRRRERQFIPLNEAVLRTEQALDTDTELPDLMRADFIRRGPYVDEVLAIAADYVQNIPWLNDYTRAWQELRAGNASAAIRSFDQAIAAAPGTAGPILGRAHAHATAGNWENAIADLQTSGGDALRCQAVAAAQLRVSNADVATVQAGAPLWISDRNGDWLWARVAADRSKEGWIKASLVRLE